MRAQGFFVARMSGAPSQWAVQIFRRGRAAICGTSPVAPAVAGGERAHIASLRALTPVFAGYGRAFVNALMGASRGSCGLRVERREAAVFGAVEGVDDKAYEQPETEANQVSSRRPSMRNSAVVDSVHRHLHAAGAQSLNFR